MRLSRSESYGNSALSRRGGSAVTLHPGWVRSGCRGAKECPLFRQLFQRRHGPSLPGRPHRPREPNEVEVIRFCLQRRVGNQSGGWETVRTQEILKLSAKGKCSFIFPAASKLPSQAWAAPLFTRVHCSHHVDDRQRGISGLRLLEVTSP
ncbi:uncharacterized protein WM277_007209 [Molossus nigricans]